MHDLQSIKLSLNKLNEENIKFKLHFYERILDRPISENLIKKYLKTPEKLLKLEKQESAKINEEKYKLWFKLSNQYLLVIVIILSEKDLYVITSWNTNRKWKKIIQK